MNLQAQEYLNQYHRQDYLAHQMSTNLLAEEAVKQRPSFWTQVSRAMRHLDRLRQVRITVSLELNAPQPTSV